MGEFWFRLDRIDLPRGLIVVDVSRSAEKLWPVFRSVLEGVGEVLPVPAHPDVCFLGDTVRRPLRDFLGAADALFPANKGRGRVVGPLFEALETEPPTHAVLVGAGPLVDLDDWASSPVARLTRFTKLVPNVSLTAGRFAEPSADIDEMAKWLDPSVVDVAVRSPTGAAFDWDAPNFRWQSGGLRSESPDGVTLRVGIVAADATPPTATLKLADGSTVSQPLEACDKPMEPPWRSFTAGEFTVLQQWMRSGEYECACGQSHPEGQWACAATGTPRALLPSLGDVTPGVCVRVRVGAFNAKLQVLRSPAVRIGEGVAVADDVGKLVLYRFDAGRAEWVPHGEATAFRPVEEGVYAMVV